MLDAKIATALNKIIQNSYLKKKVNLEEQKAQYFRVTGAHDTVLDYADLLSITLRNDDVQEFDTRFDEIFIDNEQDSHR